MDDPSPFISFNDDMKRRFQTRVYKVSIDGGFSCPNRDGTKGTEGCIFCDEKGSSSRTFKDGMSIREQVLQNIKVRKTRYRGEKYIAYFQSFTNTYAPISVLKKLYDEALEAHPDIIGLSISTRADCIDKEKLSFLSSYKKKIPYVCIEYGMQTIHNCTLEKIHRKETHEDFYKTFEMTKSFDLDHCIHVILGLIDETEQMQMQTAKKLASYGVKGVKIHHLVAMEKTYLAKMHEKGKWKPMEFDAFIHLCADFIAHLPKKCVIHRVGGNGHPMHLIEPKWAFKRRREILPLIKKELMAKKQLGVSIAEKTCSDCPKPIHKQERIKKGMKKNSKYILR